MPFTDVRESANWRATCAMSDAEYRSRIRAGHPLAASHYLNKYFFRHDVMHSFDCKGITGIAIGGLVNKLISNESRLGSNQQERLDNLNRRMKEFQKEQKPSAKMPPIRLGDLLSEGWHNLSGPLIKAGNTRHLTPFAEHIARAFLNEDDDVVLFLKNINKIYAILYGCNMFLTHEEQSVLKEATLGMGSAHMRCRQQAKDAGTFAFQIRPKAHWAQHVPGECCLINSSYVHCYGEERLQFIVSKIFKASCSGPYRKTIQKSVLTKYLTHMGIKLDL